MIFIPAKIRCDECNSEANLELGYKLGAQNIPILEYDYLPEGWTTNYYIDFYGNDIKRHLCPQHKK